MPSPAELMAEGLYRESHKALDEAIAESLSNAYGQSSLAKTPVRYLRPKPKRPINRTLGDCLEPVASGCYVKVRLPGAP